MKKRMKKMVAILCAAAVVFPSLWGMRQIEQVEATDGSEASAVSLKGFDYVTISDYAAADVSSLADGRYEYGLDPASYWLTNESSLDHKLLSMRIKYLTSGQSTNLAIAASAGQSGGLALYVSADGSEMYLYDHNQKKPMVQVENYKYTFSAKNADIKSFLNNEFLLQISFEYGDFDEDVDDTAANDVKLGFYFNGKLYQNEVVQINNCNIDIFGTRLVFGLYNEDSAMEVYSTTPEPEPVALPGYKDLTISDYGIEGTHQGTKDSNVAIQNGMTSLDKSLLSMRIKYGTSGVNTRFHVGYIKSVSSGLGIYISTDGSEMYLRTFNDNQVTTTKGTYATYKASEAGLSTFLNNEFLLQISFEFGDFDEDAADTATNDVKLGFYFNGKLYQNAATQINNCNVEKIGTGWMWQLNATDATLQLSSVTPEPEPVRLDGFDDITLSDFHNAKVYRFADRIYTVNDESIGRRYWNDNFVKFNNLMLSMKVKYMSSGESSAFAFAARANQSAGLSLYVSADGSELYLHDNNSETNRMVPGDTEYIKTFYASDAGLTSFLNNEFLLQISSEYGDFDEDETDTTANDVKLGFYFNGKFYGDAVIQINNCNMDKFGGQILVATHATTSQVYMASTDKVQDLSNGAYHYVDDTDLWVDGEQVPGIYLAKPGDYVVAVGNQNEGKKVVCYLQGDVNIDGDTDIRDLVAGIKALTTSPKTRAAIMGADMDENGIIESADTDSIRTSLVQ